jgi:hypothetical protein
VIAKPADDLAKSGFTANENSTSLEDITNYNNLSIGEFSLPVCMHNGHVDHRVPAALSDCYSAT